MDLQIGGLDISREKMLKIMYEQRKAKDPTFTWTFEEYIAIFDYARENGNKGTRGED